MNNKNAAFEYIVRKLVEWHNEIKGTPSGTIPNNFSKLSLLKLLFFVAVIKDDNQEDLLNLFNNFYALPYGPVESDIYNAMNDGNLNYYKIKDRSIEVKNSEEIPLEEDLKNRINKSIALLRGKNEQIVTYNPFQLVDITHKWESWKNAFAFAEFMNSLREEIDIEDIRKDFPFFGVN